MRKTAFLVSILTLVFFACKKDNDCKAPSVTVPADEIAQLKTFIDTSHIDATFDSRGFYYKTAAAGGTDKPNNCSVIEIGYKGTLVNGVKFDSKDLYAFSMGALITGWQYGVPLIGKDGYITLYLPPTLGYGSRPNGAIPANSILIFEIKLLNFYN
ncbi:FKBP-type peptidyl-prolyl cis-trans isomerase [Polluticaenibacter yanchengensis]|uniref:Peptidyl-prolyl cis-trans isomerase n=1 Tax=Polluticaenibacter yanchengensis TaxID=3014562 RepID=A0ABT4UHC1_9BACT|nr:FKBP-type peptidyl-prolyl cis-trans isomerase [Chitinophagaceae bacterium LY-5]